MLSRTGIGDGAVVEFGDRLGDGIVDRHVHLEHRPVGLFVRIVLSQRFGVARRTTCRQDAQQRHR